jgi:hypothetical protein
MRGSTCSVRKSGSLIPLLVCAVALVAAACACGKKSTSPAAESGTPSAPQQPAPADMSTAPTAPPATGADASAPDVGNAQVEPPPPAADTGASDAVGPQPPFRVAMTAPLSVAILAPDRAAELVGRGLGPQGEDVEGFWEPTAEDVERFFEKLPGRLEADPDRRGAEVAARLREPPAAADAVWERYRAQLAGLKVGGKRYLFANFFCEGGASDEQWRESLVMVRDGGTCYFQVWFDVETGEYTHLSINGEG